MRSLILAGVLGAGKTGLPGKKGREGSCGALTRSGWEPLSSTTRPARERPPFSRGTEERRSTGAGHQPLRWVAGKTGGR